MSNPTGDVNGDGLLDTNETWTYTCTTNIPVSTASVATVKGDANAFPTLAYAFVNILVSTPGLPNTGFPSENGTSWTVIILAILLAAVSVSLIVTLKKERYRGGLNGVKNIIRMVSMHHQYCWNRMFFVDCIFSDSS